MAAGSDVRKPELAIGRLVVETSKGKELVHVESLGPSCLAFFESVEFLNSVGKPKSQYFLVTSKRVLPKVNLLVIENSKKKKKKHSLKIVAEFLGTEDDRSLQRKPLSELYLSLEKDIFELNGVTYVALTKLKKGSSLLSRSLEVFNFSEGSESSVSWDELQCLDFGGEETQQEKNFSIRAFHLLQFTDDSHIRKRFLKEDDFQQGGKPLGPIIVNKDCQLAGFLYFLNKYPVPLLFGSNFAETGETITLSDIEEELRECASSGVYPLLKSYLQGNRADGNKDQRQEEKGPFATENSCRSISPGRKMVEYIPPKNDETMQQGETETEKPVGASGGVYPPLDPDLPSKSQVHVGVGANDTEITAGTSGHAYPLLNPDLKSKSQVHTGVSAIDTEMPVGVSGGSYLPLVPDVPSNSQVGVNEIDKSNPDSASHLAAANKQPVEKNVSEAKINITDANNGSNSDLSEVDLQQPPVNGGGSNENLQEEKGLEQGAECAVDGGRLNDSHSLTEPSYKLFEVKVVKLPPKNDKDTTSSRVVPPDHDRVNSQPSSVTFDAVCEGASNITPEGRSTQEHNRLKKSYSFPSDLTKKDEYAQLKRTRSELRTRVLEKKEFSLSDPLAKTLLDCLELLEGLCRCLDKEYKYGACKCWKHIAELFGIEEQEYQEFKCSQIQSPTEVMFEYLQTCSPDLVIGEIKCGLHSIGREDVVSVLVKYEETYRTMNDETLVCSLFDSDPDIIGEIAFLLDIQKKGLKNWSHLAAKLGIPRTAFKSFENCSTENPTQGLFELLKIHFPRSTVGELIGQLEDIKRQDVIKAIKESPQVSEGSLIKDLMADLDVMDNVCDLLNQKQRSNKVKGWKHLGTKFGMKKEILDDLSPIEEDLVCPTAALVANLGASRPWLTIADLIFAIHKIDRKDALDVLKIYLPDGCIANLLTSCDCERCQMSRQVDKAGETDEL